MLPKKLIIYSKNKGGCMIKKQCDCIVGYEIIYPNYDNDNASIEEVRKSHIKTRREYRRLNLITKYCPDCGKKIVVLKRGSGKVFNLKQDSK